MITIEIKRNGDLYSKLIVPATLHFAEVAGDVTREMCEQIVVAIPVVRKEVKKT